jgi:hypothetical protein
MKTVVSYRTYSASCSAQVLDLAPIGSASEGYFAPRKKLDF